jgi:hypothetical protein
VSGRHTGARQAGSTSPQTDTLAQVWAQSDPVGMTLFDYTQAIPSNGRDLHWIFTTVRSAGTAIWEEDLGVTMEPLNNPGWRLDVRRA